MKHKKLKKKLARRRTSDIIAQNSEEELVNEVEPFVEISVKNYALDFKSTRPVELHGAKGHCNYYSKLSTCSGTYYYEVYVKSLDFNMNEFISSKRTDEYSKKYFDNILDNLKGYAPTIRIGFVNAVGDMELPLGADGNSFGYRNSDGALTNGGEIVDKNEPFSKAATIGVLINLKPPRPGFLKSVAEEKNTECYIKYYLNGIKQDKEFLGILEGNYHAAVTLYNFAEVSINFGPNFNYNVQEDNKIVKPFNSI